MLKRSRFLRHRVALNPYESSSLNLYGGSSGGYGGYVGGGGGDWDFIGGVFDGCLSGCLFPVLSLIALVGLAVTFLF